MPSLKDLRNRIASVKATQKITKAMQMVAAAKLRRAQLAAEAARPFAERMEKVLANISAGFSGTKPPLLGGTGNDANQLLVVCTAERGLCGAFNSSIARLARDKAVELQAQGKKVKIMCVGRKGYDLLKRQFANEIIEVIELRGVRQLGFGNADEIGRKIIALFEKGEFDVATLFFSRFRSVIAQIPTALQIIPAELSAQRRPCACPLRDRARAERGSLPAFAAEYLGAGIPRASRKRRVRAGRADERDGQRHAQRRRNDQEADIEI